MKLTVILDGYNVTNRMRELRRGARSGLEETRRRLVQSCTTWLQERRDIERLIVVFDGDSSVPGISETPVRGVRVVFTRTGESADSHILNLVSGSMDVSRYLVVSDDAEVASGARARGAEVKSVAGFLSMVMARRQAAAGAGTTDEKEKLSSEEERALNEELMKEWGLDGS